MTKDEAVEELLGELEWLAAQSGLSEEEISAAFIAKLNE